VYPLCIPDTSRDTYMPSVRRFSVAERRDAEKARRETAARVLRRQASFDSIQKALEEAEAERGVPEMRKRIQDAEDALRQGLDDGVDDETLTAGLARCLALSSAEAEKESHERMCAEEEARAKASKAQALVEEKQRKARNDLVAKIQKGTLNGSLVTIKGLVDGDDAHLNGKIGRVVPRDSFSGTAISPLAMRIAQQGQGALHEKLADLTLRDPAEDQGLGENTLRRCPSTELSSAQVRDLLYDSPTSARKGAAAPPDEADFMQRLQRAEQNDSLSRDQLSASGSDVARSDASRSTSVNSSPNGSFVRCHSWTSPPQLPRPPRAVRGQSSEPLQRPRPPHEPPENDAKPDSSEQVRVCVYNVLTEARNPTPPPSHARRSRIN
jgi:hypothetical protein